MGKHGDKDQRELQIAAICRRTEHPKLATRTLIPLEPESIINREVDLTNGILFIRHGERPHFAGLTKAQQNEVPLTTNGIAVAKALGMAIGRITHVISSPLPRCVQTAQCLISGRRMSLEQDDGLKTLFANSHASAWEEYTQIKSLIGWQGLMSDWIDGRLQPGIFLPVETVAFRALGAIRPRDPRDTGPVVAITHDFVVVALLAALRGGRSVSVPYLGSVLITWNEAESFAKDMVNR